MVRKEWTTVALNKRHICFLDEISKGSKFSGGRKLSRTAIVRAILKTATKLNIDVNQVRSERELKERVLESFRRGV
jgi:hypothetical protein